MWKKLSVSTLAIAAVIGATGQAHADTKLREVWIKDRSTSGQFAAKPILVVDAKDGKFTGIKSGTTALFPVKVHAKINNVNLKYQIFQAMVSTAWNSGGGKVANPARYSVIGAYTYPRKIDKNETVRFEHWKLNTAKIGAKAAAACQARINAGQSPHKQFSTTMTVPLWYRVKAGKESKFNSAGSGKSFDKQVTKTDSVDVSVDVRCPKLKWKSPTASNDFGFDHGPFKVKGIKLFLTTFSHAFSKPNPATKCKKTRLMVRVRTSKKGPVKFRLWKKVGNKPMTSKVIDAWAKHDGNGGFKAEYTQWISVNKTTYVQAKAEELVNPIGLSTPWEDITLHCTGAGGGGLANPSNNNDDQLPAPKVKGSLNIADTGGTKCPRLGQILFKVNSTQKIPLQYKLTCGNGINKTGALTLTGSNKNYNATGKVMFQNTKTQNVGCLLKRKKNNKWVPLALGAKQFTCIKKDVETGSNDLTVDPGKPDNPLPTKKVKGDFSFIDNGGTKCGRDGKVLMTFQSTAAAPHGNVHWSLDCTNGRHFSGVANPAKGANGKYIAAALKTFKINKSEVYSCALKTKKPGKAKLHKWKSKKFHCVSKNVDTAADGLTAKPKPTHGASSKEKKLKRLKAAKEKAAKAKAAREKAKKAKEKAAKLKAKRAKEKAAKEKAAKAKAAKLKAKMAKERAAKLKAKRAKEKAAKEKAAKAKAAKLKAKKAKEEADKLKAKKAKEKAAKLKARKAKEKAAKLKAKKAKAAKKRSGESRAL